jgi:hypothetical protein
VTELIVRLKLSEKWPKKNQQMQLQQQQQGTVGFSTETMFQNNDEDDQIKEAPKASNFAQQVNMDEQLISNMVKARELSFYTIFKHQTVALIIYNMTLYVGSC